jgi:pilus assembly protein Flp/PilA
MTALLYRVMIQLKNDLRGQDLVEYALMAGFVAVGAGAVFPTSIMTNMSTIFSSVGSVLANAAAS